MNANRTPGINHRQHRQSHRIGQGIKSGELTRAEVKQLRESGQEIREAKQAARADGKVTKEERQQIHELLNARSQDIFELKHNDTNKYV